MRKRRAAECKTPTERKLDVGWRLGLNDDRPLTKPGRGPIRNRSQIVERHVH